MKQITATIPLSMLDGLRETLVALGINGMTISATVAPSWAATDAQVALETVIGHALVPHVVEAIAAACRDVRGEGVLIGVSDVHCGVRIRNAEIIHEG
jgi:nitrogen regulatory protein PII